MTSQSLPVSLLSVRVICGVRSEPAVLLLLLPARSLLPTLEANTRLNHLQPKPSQRESI